MRRHRLWAAALLLGAAGLLLTPSASQAQLRMGFGGYGMGIGYGSGYYGYYPSYYSYGYSPYNWGYAYSPSSYWYGSNWSYPSYSWGGYSYPSYSYWGGYSSPSYYSGDYYSSPSTTYSYPAPSYGSPSYSYGAMAREERANTAQVDVRVPDPNAEIWIEGSKTQQRGTLRLFESPPLNPDKNYTYDIRARWTENGREVERTKTVPVRANERANVDFSADTRSRTDDIERDRRGTDADKKRDNSRVDEIDRGGIDTKRPADTKSPKPPADSGRPPDRP
jgi:uncharacterized protein (TIGR03000 family)